MGIDVYLKWRGQTKAEKEAQVTGFSVVHGHVGYLREAYHGEPYVTRILFPEAFHNEAGDVRIRAATMRTRLPKAVRAAIQRQRIVYQERVKKTDPIVQSFINFVELAEKLEKEGKEPTVYASW